MKWLGISAAAVVVALIGYGMAFPSATVRYRLTLEASVDGEPKIGSGVIEVTYGKNSQFISTSLFSIDVRGEAVALDLGSRGVLFALLKEDSDSRSGPEWIVLRAFHFPGGAMPSPVDKGLGDIRALSGKVELPLTSLPLLVRFRDLDDPKSVERVDPSNIAKSFGQDARLVGATLEIVPSGALPLSLLGLTGEAITTGIDERLAWLRRLKGGYLDGAFAGGGPALSNILFGGNFKKG